MSQLTFQSLCKSLKNRPSLKSYAQELNTLTGAIAALIENPVVGSVAAFFKSLSEKDKLISLGSTVLDAILNRTSAEDYNGRVKQMQDAYGIIYFTAFFDELDSRLPDNIRRSIQLSLKEKQSMFQSSAFSNVDNHADRREVLFPDIVCGHDKVDRDLLDIYSSMASRLRDFVRGLSFQDVAEDKDIQAFDQIIKSLPTAAVERFHNQYLILCSKFNEFYIFTQLEHEKKKQYIWDSQYQTILSIAMRSQSSSETGLANLKDIIIGLPHQIKEERIQEIVGELIKKYQKNIERPLISTKDGEENLIYPPISEAFIPQAYKLLLYSGKERLEQPETWKNLDPRQDMTSFWAKYCIDPNSVNELLLILGEPGGGKSLLTEILCARTITPSNICIRIPLRNYDMEEDIEAIVCKQINRDGDASDPIQTFKFFAEEFRGNPIMLFFDGYDEVMQATGGVYRNLLTKIRQFQERCQEQNRPVRIIITSRETLIDKADIPKRTTVMKLLEFDDERKNRWINIWNAYNHETLVKAGIQDFALPVGNKDINDLSGQPLLLLMLAIYDANFEIGTNALKRANGEAENMDRTKLYDELLRRFIRRELRKGQKGNDRIYEEAPPEEQDAMVDEEMKKLGIAALGMFVREKLSLKVGELEDDLGYMNAKVTTYDSKNKKILKNAEALFGSFFFIHDSRSENEEDEKEAAFEFLHKTFYEFLVADLILQYLIDAADDLIERKKSSRRGESHYWEALEKPDSIDNAYYATLNSSCLCAEPEVIEMIAEWKDGKLSKYFHAINPDFIGEMGQVLTDLFSKHLDIIQTKVFAPLVDRKGGLASGRDYLNACAVYLINLIILQILINKECKIDIEKWRYISQFLRMNIPLLQENSQIESSGKKLKRNFKIDPYEEMILKFMDLFLIEQCGDKIVLTKKQQIGKIERDNLQEVRIDAFNFMQDNVTRRVYQLHDLNNSSEQREEYVKELIQQGFDFGFEVIIEQIREIVYSLEGWASRPLDEDIQYVIEKNIINGVRCLQQNRVDGSLVLDWLLCISRITDKLGLSGWKGRIHISQMRNAWMELGDAIFRLYGNKKGIISVFLESTKKLNYENILMQRPLLQHVFSYRPNLSYESVATLAEMVPSFFQTPFYEADFFHLGIDTRRLLLAESPRTIAAILKLLYISGETGPSDKNVRIIQSRWEHYLDISPEELPDLLEVYLQMGEFMAVKKFLRNITKIRTNWINRLVDQYSESLVSFLNIARIVGEDRNLSRCIEHRFAGNRSHIKAEQFPGVIMRLAHNDVLSGPAYIHDSFAVPIFFEQYPLMFGLDSKQAIYILYQIALKRIESVNYADLLRACKYSLQYYNLVLEESVTTTAQMLTLCEIINNSISLKSILDKNSRAIYTNNSFAFYARSCFNKAIFTRDRAAVSSLECMLNNMNSEIEADMEEYFRKQLPFLQAYSWSLAKTVRELYGID